MISKEERQLALEALGIAKKYGAQKARITLSKSQEDLVATLNGEIDRITRCLDRSMNIALFVDGRFGSFSTNKLEIGALDNFIGKAADSVRMLAEDSCRDLPSPERCCKNAISGNELDLVDAEYYSVTPEMRKTIALNAAAFGKCRYDGYELISEEGEYSDSLYDTLLVDTNGLECRHTETSFDYGVESTIEADGEKYTGWWWESSSRLKNLDYEACGSKAVSRAAAQIGSEAMKSGKYTMVLDPEVASKVVSPLLNALNAYSIQQNNSFLIDSKGKKVFPEGLTLMDLPHIKGQNCSKLFDSEGVATTEGPVISGGVVQKYFVNTYMAGKLQMEPTNEEATRPAVLPWPEKGLDRNAILKRCGEGILVTEFNGGNCNSATGDFSYGIEGMYFKDGRIVRPVSGMVVTGNFLDLWSRFIAAGEDARPCASKLIPTLAFGEVDFSG